MNGKNKENLEELFGKFFRQQEAKETASQISQTEQLLRDNPAPQPDEQLVAKIKGQIAPALLRKRQRTARNLLQSVAAVAAVIIIATMIHTNLSQKSRIEQPVPADFAVAAASIWNSNEITGDDADLALIADEIDEIESEVLALKYGEESLNGTDELVEFEIELMETNGDFWKG